VVGEVEAEVELPAQLVHPAPQCLSRFQAERALLLPRRLVNSFSISIM
jgi:hypothetical protein